MRSVAFPCIVLLAAIGCSRSGGGREDARPPAAASSATIPQLQGRIRVSGAWALYPMMVRWVEEFGRLHPEVRVDVAAGGAGKGAADALAGLVDIGMVSRAIRPEEIRQGGVFVPLVKDAVFPTINAANPVLGKGLASRGGTRSTLVDLFLHGREMT